MTDNLSRYAQSTAPQPTQASLDRLVAGLAAVRVYAGGMDWDRPMEDEVLAEVDDAPSIDMLKEALRIEDGSAGHCMCDGEPTLELLDAAGKRLAVLGLHHGMSIRWAGWKDDARLVQGMELLMWLDEVGVPEPLEEFMSDSAERASEERAWNDWVGAMPEALRSLPETAWQRVMEKRDVFPLLAALAKAYPDAKDRVLALFEWHAHGGISWSGFPTYENLPAAILAQFPEKDLVALCESAELGPAQICGAARFLACNDPARPPGLPSQPGPTGEVVMIPRRSSPPPPMSSGLRAKLLWSCVFGTDQDGRQRAEAAFLDAEDRAFLAAVRAARPLPLLVRPSDVPMARNTTPQALAKFLSGIDAMVPSDLPLVLAFEAAPSGEASVAISVRDEDEARLPDLRTTLSRLPPFNTAAGTLRFGTWYGKS